jgi:hypothetical protein
LEAVANSDSEDRAYLRHTYIKRKVREKLATLAANPRLPELTRSRLQSGARGLVVNFYLLLSDFVVFNGFIRDFESLKGAD